MEAKMTVRIQPDPVEIKVGTEARVDCLTCNNVTEQYVSSIESDADGLPVCNWRCHKCSELRSLDADTTLAILLLKQIQGR